MSQVRPPTLDQIFDANLQALATALCPQTVACYRTVVHRFLRYLHAAHPPIMSPAQLRRDPHLLGWIASLGQGNPSLSNRTRRACLICLRRLLDDLADNGHAIAPGLIIGLDIPPRDVYLPKPLSPENDRLVNAQLRHIDDLCANALLLMRLTGMRIGECLRLKTDCLKHLGPDQWALHVPLGKLHTERWVPIDEDAHKILDRIFALRGSPSTTDPPALLFPLPHRGGYFRMRKTLNLAAQQVGCPPSIRPHQLRHSYATEMLRAGVSLPALMHLLGHKDIRMTMWYVQVTQKDLQREYHAARESIATLHSMPQLSFPTTAANITTGIPTLSQALATIRHLFEMFRRTLPEEKNRRKLQRFIKRLMKISTELNKLSNA